jgi:hypothetical protein
MPAKLVEKALAFAVAEHQVCEGDVERRRNAGKCAYCRYDEPSLQLRDVAAAETGLLHERVERVVRGAAQTPDARTDGGREGIGRGAVTDACFRRHAERTVRDFGSGAVRIPEPRSALAERALMAARDELFEPRRDARGELARPADAHALLEHGETRALLLLAMMDQELAEHANARIEREVAGARDEQAFERVAKERMLLERFLLGAVRSMSERIDELLFGECVADDFVGERAEEAALRRFFHLVEQIDDAAMLGFEDGFER